MATDRETAKRKARTAWWLRVCRITDPRRPKLAAVAEAAGVKSGSGSMVSLWERNRGPHSPRLDQLERLAVFYGVPLKLFTEPPVTDEERLARYRQLALGAIDAEQQDWDEAAEEDGPGDEDGHDEPPRRPPA